MSEADRTDTASALGSNRHFGCIPSEFLVPIQARQSSLWISPIGRNSTVTRLLRHCVDKPRDHDLNLIDFALEEQVASECRDGPSFGKSGRIRDRELGSSLPVGSRDELGGAFSDRDVHGGLPDRTAPATRNKLVFSDPHKPFSVPIESRRVCGLLASPVKRMDEISTAWSPRALNPVQQLPERTGVQRCFLAFRIFDAATICMARVICDVLPIDLMRRRMSRRLGIVHRAGVRSHTPRIRRRPPSTRLSTLR